MSVKLTIEITGPLDAEDRDLLSGVAVMTLAIANHEMAKNAFPETFGDEEVEAELPPPPKKSKAKIKAEKAAEKPCAFLNPDDPNLICVGYAGHRGRHRFRVIATAEAPLAN